MKKILTLIILLLIRIHSYSQFTIPDIVNLNSHYKICERVILETDRDIYMVGEQINVVCNTIDPIINRNLELNKIVYLEFFTSQNQTIEQIKIELNNGMGSGIFNIPRKLSSGRYYIRAYTNYMKNYGASTFAYTSLSIINPFVEIKKQKEYSSIPSKLEKCILFPEGGQIVYGENNLIVGKFTDINNKPTPCNARLIDGNNKIITTFTTNLNGLGTFIFNPVLNQHYKIEATNGDDYISSELRIPESCISLKKLNQNKIEIRYKIISNQFYDYPVTLEIGVLGNYFPIYKLGINDSIISLPPNGLPKGIVQFRLCNEKDEILSTKNEYIPSNQLYGIKLTTNKELFKNRELIKLSIEGAIVDPIDASFSMSVFLVEPYLIDSIKKQDRLKQLQSSLYPFIANNKIPIQQILKDSILLNQLLISTIINDSLVSRRKKEDYKDMTYFPERNHDLIFGTIYDNLMNPISSSKLIQTWIDTISSMETVLTDTVGQFVLEANRTGNNTLIIRPSKNFTGNIKLQDEFFPDFFTIAKEGFYNNLMDSSLLNQQLINLQINDSYRDPEIKKTNRGSSPFYIEPDNFYNIDDYQALPTLKDFLYEVVPGLLPYNTKGETIIKFAFQTDNTLFGNNPLYLVDGIPIFDANTIAQLKCSDLKSIGIVYEKYFYQNESFDGIIDIHSKQGDASILKTAPNFSHSFIGVQDSIEKSSEIPYLNTHEPYFRTQLYWNSAMLHSDILNKTISFIAPDNDGFYLVRCSIKTPDGSISYYYTSFKVEKD